MARIKGVVLEDAWSESGIHYELLRYNLRSTSLYGVKINGEETHFRSMDAATEFLQERKITTRAAAESGRKRRQEMLEEERLRSEVRKELGLDVVGES